MQVANAQMPADYQYTIPVVIHVLHQGGIENISDTQILDALRILNEDFNKLNADTVSIASVYKGIAANMHINFCLATIDPNGSPTTGIERINTPYTNYGDSIVAKSSVWDRSKYLNIWVVRRVTTGAEAFALRPGTADNLPGQDGILITHHWMGSIGTSSPTQSRALTFLAGEYLNLKTTFVEGLACIDTDEVADTPPSHATTCDTSIMSCIGVRDNVQNFMSYTFCTRMFTNGQKARVDSTLNSSVAQRNNLWSAQNLAITGCGAPLNVKDASVQQLSLYPNPATGTVFISNIPKGDYTITITDLTAKAISINTGIYIDGKYETDIGNFPAGVYIIKLNAVNSSLTGRIIKQ